jgi:hypothetical protein
VIFAPAVSRKTLCDISGTIEHNMKKFLILSIFSFISCSKQEIKFQRIDANIYDKDKMISRIQPNKKYDYWVYVRSYFASNKIHLIRQYGDKSLKHLLNLQNFNKGFLEECIPNGCYDYIAYIENGQPNYITSKKDFKHFLGDIDNLSEALLSARINSLYVDYQNMKGSVYRKTKHGYELHLVKSSGFCIPGENEAFEFIIDYSGNLSMKNIGMY